MMRKEATLLIIAIAVMFSASIKAQQLTDNEKLGMAIEYFQSSKYHEALLIFENLEKSHKLNPRYVAYMGLCYYHEWNFEKASKHFEEALPSLNQFAPHERSIYIFTCAESYFAMEQYEKALSKYEEALTLCYNNEKGDIYFKMGYCFIKQGRWIEARDTLKLSNDAYINYRNTSELKSRIKQIEIMIKGCDEKIPLEQRLNQPVPDEEPQMP